MMLEPMVQDRVTKLLVQQDGRRQELAQAFDCAGLEAKMGEAVNRPALRYSKPHFRRVSL